MRRPLIIRKGWRFLVGRDDASPCATVAAIPSIVISACAATAVNPKRSVQQDHIVCLECGGKFKSLKRHIGSNHDLTPDEYRAKWELASDYPMVAPGYAAQRSALAKEIGLGRKLRQKAKPARKKKGV